MDSSDVIQNNIINGSESNDNDNSENYVTCEFGDKNEKQNEDFKLEGNRIVSINKLFYSFKKLNSHATKFGCTLQNLFVTGEKKFGLDTEIYLKCNMCNMSLSIDLCNTKTKIKFRQTN